jgi:hypothetical protein
MECPKVKNTGIIEVLFRKTDRYYIINTNLKNKEINDLSFKIIIKTKTGKRNDIIRIYIGRYADR